MELPSSMTPPPTAPPLPQPQLPNTNSSTIQPCPPPSVIRPLSLIPWTTDLFSCFEDVGNCCLTCLCPCVTFGRIAEIVDGGTTSCGVSGALYAMIMCVTGCSCLYSCFYRSKLRGQHLLEETPCCDCLVHCCCESCALCQEYRELRRRGFDPRLGWQGRGRYVAPVVEGRMRR